MGLLLSVVWVIVIFIHSYMSRSMIKLTNWPVLPAKTQISLSSLISLFTLCNTSSSGQWRLLSLHRLFYGFLLFAGSYFKSLGRKCYSCNFVPVWHVLGAILCINIQKWVELYAYTRRLVCWIFSVFILLVCFWGFMTQSTLLRSYSRKVDLFLGRLPKRLTNTRCQYFHQ